MNQTNFWKQVWTFFVVSLKGTFRSFAAVFFGLLFPLVFVAAFGLASSASSKVEIGLITSETSAYTFWKNSLQSSASVNLTTGDKDTIINKFKDNSLDAVIEANPTDAHIITLYVSNKRQTTAAIAEQIVSTYVDKATIAQSGVQPIYTIRRENIDTTNPRYIDFVLPGLIGFSLLSGAIQGLANSFLTLKKTQALKRLFAAPASKTAFLIGKSLASLAFSLLQVTILFGTAMTVFDYNPVNGWLGLAQMYVIIILGVALFQGFGFVIAGISSTTEQAGAFGQLITLPQFMLGGTFFAITTLPDWLQSIVKLLPLYSFNEAMRNISLEGLLLSDPKVLLHLLPLGVWMIIIYVVAVRVFRIK